MLQVLAPPQGHPESQTLPEGEGDMRLIPNFHAHYWTYVKGSLDVDWLRGRTSYTEVCKKCGKRKHRIVKHI
jgi:hypothetical protein